MARAAQQQQNLRLAPQPPALKDWNEVDEAIKDVALLDLVIEESENEMNALIADVQARLAPKIKELKEGRAMKADRILSFAREHRSDFGAKKSRKFNFGAISFTKAAEAVKFILDELQIISNLKKLGLAIGVVKVKESVDKNALAGVVPEEKRAKVGFEIVPTGDEPQLKIERKSIEILKQARKAS